MIYYIIFLLIYLYSQKLKEELNNFNFKMMSIDNAKYNYFQGYHDIGLFFLILYFNTPNMGINTFQRVSEFYIKDYLHKTIKDTNTISGTNTSSSMNTEPSTNPTTNNNSFDFEATLNLLMKVIKEINPDVSDSLEEICESPYFALPWIITWFTHNIDSISLQYRIFDYLICSHPIAVFVLSATVIIINSSLCRLS